MPACPPANSGVLTSEQRSALADARDALEQSDGDLAEAMARFGGPSLRWRRGLLATLLLAAAGLVGVVLMVGPAAFGPITLVLGLGAPLLVGLALVGETPSVDGPVEQPPG